ncbi:MAG: DNA repair protein RecO [Candidatus Pacebacteria bacterium]|nr:DNA repair protein RecO [Candidatus Paceibacterota bacterium]
MFVHYRSQGFIFKKEDRGDADQLFLIYTKDFGKVEILGKAIRKISSKLRAGAEIFYLSEIEFIQGKTSKTLTDAIPIAKFKNIRKDLKSLKIAYRISGILESLIKGQEVDEEIWHLLIEVFRILDSSSFEGELPYYYFLWNFLAILGYQLSLYDCVLCQKKITPEKIYFSPREGGVICQNCSKRVRSCKEVSQEIVKMIRIILKKNWKSLSRIKLTPDYMNFLEKISQNYLSYVLEAFK